MEGADKACAVQADTPTTSAHQRLHAEIEEAHYAVNNLEARLDNVFRQSEPTGATPDSQPSCSPGTSEHVRTVHNASDSVAHLTSRVRSIIDRLEV